MAIPKHPRERTGRLPQKFFNALGHLQYAYTTLEVSLACLSSELVTAGYDPKAHFPLFDRVSAVVGGMRMDVAKDTLKRILRVMETPQEVMDYVHQLFAQISEISYFRNRLTHYHTTAWFRKRGEFLNTDIEVAREQDKAVTFWFGYDALDAARHDIHATIDIMDELFAPDVERFPLVLPTWQYKPSMLIRLDRRS